MPWRRSASFFTVRKGLDGFGIGPMPPIRLFLNLQRALSLGAGNWSSSSLATFAALSAHLAGERQPKTGAQPGAANNRTVERERRLPRRQESKVGMHIDHVGQS